MSAESLIGAASIVSLAAISPGPNNFAVMAVAGREGLGGAVPAIVGIVLGSLALLALTGMGAGAILSADPRLLPSLAVVGCTYFIYLGTRTIAQSFRPPLTQRVSSSLPSGTMGLFIFQFINPKAWMLTISAVSAAQIDADSTASFLPLIAIFLVIPTICLAFWSSLGTAVSKLLRSPSIKAWFDRAMGTLLILSAVLLIR